ncbi:MAG TPA: hypothetical protein VF756_02585 [Thermoanaerobaculia bacterium]
MATAKLFSMAAVRRISKREALGSGPLNPAHRASALSFEMVGTSSPLREGADRQDDLDAHHGIDAKFIKKMAD